MAAVLVVGLVGAGWHFATTRMEAELATWRQAREAEGWRIRHAPPERAGFPLNAALRLRDVVVDTPSRLGWQADRVTLRLGVADLAAAHVEVAGAQGLRHASGVTPVFAEGLRLRTLLADGTTTAAADRLSAEGFSAQAVTGLLSDLQLELAAARLEAPGLPPVEDAALAARVNLPLHATAAQWQEAGGQLRVDRLEFRSGNVQAQFSGQFSLDRALQPEGYGGLSVTNASDAVAVLSSAGLISNDLVRPLRVLVTFSSRVPPEGGPPRLDVPIELRNRRLIAARMPLVSFPPLDWR